MGIYEIVEHIKNFTDIAHVNTAFIGDVYELNHRQDVRYPASVVTQGTHTSDESNQVDTYSINVFLVDRLLEDKSNELDVQDWAIEGLKEVKRLCEDTQLGWEASSSSINPFTERFDSLCAGAFMTLRLNIQMNDCFSPRFVTSVNGKTGDVRIEVPLPTLKTINGRSLIGSGDIEVPTKDEFDEAVASIEKLDEDKVNKNELKTINGESLIGEGDIKIKGDVEEAPEDDKQYVRKDGEWVENAFTERFFLSNLTLDESTDIVSGSREDIAASHNAMAQGKTLIINCSENNRYPIVTNTHFNGSQSTFSFVHLDKSYIVTIDASENITTQCTKLIGDAPIDDKDYIRVNGEWSELVDKNFYYSNLYFDEDTETVKYDNIVDLGDTVYGSYSKVLVIKSRKYLSPTTVSEDKILCTFCGVQDTMTQERHFTFIHNKIMYYCTLTTKAITTEKVTIEGSVTTEEFEAYKTEQGERFDQIDAEIEATNTYISRVETNKQDVLVSGQNIKTVNGESLIGEGDIEIAYDDTEVKAEIADVKAIAESKTTMEEVEAKGYLTEETEPQYTADKPNIALKSEIPSLDGYATEQWVEDKGYLTTEVEPQYTADKPTLALKSEIPSLDGYATEERVDEVETKVDNLEPRVTTLEDKVDVLETKIDNVYTKEESDAKYLTEIPSEYVTETELESKGYLTEETEPQYTTDKPTLALKSEIPSLDGYATEQWVEDKGYLTEHQHLKTINGESLIGEGDIEIKGGGTNIINLTQEEYNALVDKDPNVIYNITDATDIDVYSKEESDAKYQPKGNYLTEETEPQYNADKANIALKSEIPSLDGYATESWVDTRIGNKITALFQYDSSTKTLTITTD